MPASSVWVASVASRCVAARRASPARPQPGTTRPLDAALRSGRAPRLHRGAWSSGPRSRATRSCNRSLPGSQPSRWVLLRRCTPGLPGVPATGTSEDEAQDTAEPEDWIALCGVSLARTLSRTTQGILASIGEQLSQSRAQAARPGAPQNGADAVLAARPSPTWRLQVASDGPDASPGSGKPRGGWDTLPNA